MPLGHLPQPMLCGWRRPMGAFVLGLEAAVAAEVTALCCNTWARVAGGGLSAETRGDVLRSRYLPGVEACSCTMDPVPFACKL